MAITKPDDTRERMGLSENLIMIPGNLLAAVKADRNCVARAWERINHTPRVKHVPKDGGDPVVRVTIDDSDLSLILAEFSRLGRREADLAACDALPKVDQMRKAD